MTNLDSLLKSRDITLSTKVHLVKAMVFPAVMYGCESWTIKKAEHRRIDAFELWCWRRLLRNLYAGQEATARTGHGTAHWFQIRKGVCQGCILSPCLFNFYAEYIMRNAGLEETQAGIKIAGRNLNNLRCADDTTLVAESEEELKSLLMKVKVESEKVSLKLNIQKTKIRHPVPSLDGK